MSDAENAAEVPVVRKPRSRKPKLTALQRQLRDAAIVGAAHAGWPTKQIASDYSVSERSVQAIVQNYSKRPTALDVPTPQVMQDAVRRYEAHMANLLAMAEANAIENPAVALGAEKAYGQALADYMRLMADMGHMPKDYGAYGLKLQTEAVIRRMIEAVPEGDPLQLVLRGLIEEMKVRKPFELIEGGDAA
jgi:hypothetical protein